MASTLFYEGWFLLKYVAHSPSAGGDSYRTLTALILELRIFTGSHLVAFHLFFQFYFPFTNAGLGSDKATFCYKFDFLSGKPISEI